MNTKKRIGLLLLLTILSSLVYWLGYQHGSSAGMARLRAPSNLKQIGLAFRESHNTWSRFQATGEVLRTEGDAFER